MPFSERLSPKVRQQLSSKIIVPLVGPSSVGKTTIMRAVAASDNEFNRSSGFTTRPIREGEEPDTYRFLGNSLDIQKKILQQFENGELVQFAIHPTTSFMYGTSLEDYAGKYNLLDTLSSEVINFQTLGFAACRTIMIVASIDDWQQRFDSRGFGIDESKQRIAEGITSLTWGLEQEGAVRWVENKEGDISDAVEHVTAIAKNQTHANDNAAKQLGNDLLYHLTNIGKMYQ